MRIAKWLVCGIGVAVTVFAVSLAAQGAKPQQDPDILGALLVEVRGLRQAMEQIGTSGARVQLSLGRLQLQEQRVSATIRRLESVRDARAKAEQDHASSMAQFANMEKLFKDNAKDAPPGEMNPFLAMIAGFKKSVAMSEAEIQRLQNEEAQLEAQIATEQARWADINRALEDLERTLSKR